MQYKYHTNGCYILSFGYELARKTLYMCLCRYIDTYIEGFLDIFSVRVVEPLAAEAEGRLSGRQGAHVTHSQPYQRVNLFQLELILLSAGQRQRVKTAIHCIERI